MRTIILAAAALLTTMLLLGCTHHEVEVKPIKVEPIHITIDINVKVEVEKELDDFFDFEDDSEGAE